MRLFYRFSAIFLYSVAVLLCAGQTAQAQSSAAKTADALEVLHNWLGDDENADAWRRYLKSEQLQEQLALGQHADRVVLQDVLDAYASEADGLHKSRFAAVRQAVEAWLEGLPQIPADRLADEFRKAEDRFHPLTDEDVQVARETLDKALVELDEFLLTGGRLNAVRWQSYLRWEEMQAQLSAEAGPDWKVLQSIALEYYANRPGIEDVRFLAVRNALKRYADTLLISSNDKSEEYYRAYLARAAERLEAFVQDPTPEDAQLIGKTVGWLERFGQAPELVSAVRHHYWGPNAILQFSEEMLQTGVEMEVDETVGVREVILGTSIRGSGRMTGIVSLDLVPSADVAALDITLSGNTVSRNVGRNGPVTIFSNGNTSVNARKQLTISAAGIASQPARASCRTSSRVSSVRANSNIVRQIAWNKIGRSQGQANSIASRRAESRVRQQVDGQVAELTEQANLIFEERVRKPLTRRDAFPREVKTSTTDTHLHMSLLQATADQLAATTEPPALTDDHDMAARVHESFVGNLSQAVLGGITLTDERLAELAEELLGEVPEELKITEEDDPWSITFASERPIDVRFDDHLVSVFVRSKGFTRGPQEVKQAVEISATYELTHRGNGLRLVRQGDVQVKFGASNRLSVSQVAMKTFIQKKFDDLFKPEVESDGLALPGKWEQVGKLRLVQMYCDDGWIALGWDQPPRTARTASLDR